MKIEVGQKLSYERAFSLEDVKQFGELSGDKGIHHVVPDNLGRLMVQGLLTATIPTKLGGDINYIAKDMSLKFLKPVYVGDKIKCEAAVIATEQREKFNKITIKINCHNQLGDEVLSGETNGIVRI